MVDQIPEVAETRRALVESFRDELRKQFAGVVDTIKGGEWDGVPAVTEKDVIGILDVTFADRLPAPSERHAEVTTPAEIRVSAVCPLCGIPSLVLLTATPELHADSSGKTIHVKTRAKAAHHTCGQLPLAAVGEGGEGAAVAEGQTAAWDIGDVTGERCPYPDCALPAEHKGDHKLLTDKVDEGPDVEDGPSDPTDLARDELAGDDDDLLPGGPKDG